MALRASSVPTLSVAATTRAVDEHADGLPAAGRHHVGNAVPDAHAWLHPDAAIA